MLKSFCQNKLTTRTLAAGSHNQHFRSSNLELHVSWLDLCRRTDDVCVCVCGDLNVDTQHTHTRYVQRKYFNDENKQNDEPTGGGKKNKTAETVSRFQTQSENTGEQTQEQNSTRRPRGIEHRKHERS